MCAGSKITSTIQGRDARVLEVAPNGDLHLLVSYEAAFYRNDKYMDEQYKAAMAADANYHCRHYQPALGVCLAFPKATADLRFKSGSRFG